MELKIEQSELNELVRAFHLMWGNFPEPVQLAYKSREVVALNSACESIGRVVGMNCAKHGAPEAHRGCLANKAISAQQTAWKKTKNGEKEVLCYWIPVPEYPDFFIHFGVGATIDYDEIPEMDPTKE